MNGNTLLLDGKRITNLFPSSATATATVVELPPEEWDATLAFNVTAIWESSRITAELMEDGGRILNISPIAAEIVIPRSGRYSATKLGTNRT